MGFVPSFFCFFWVELFERGFAPRSWASRIELHKSCVSWVENDYDDDDNEEGKFGEKRRR